MSTTTINPDKLARFEDLHLDHGSHPSFDAGHCAMEVVSWLADEGHTDAPQCASPVLARFVIRLNDRWSDEKRQALKPYLLRMIGTGGDGLDPVRERIAAQHVAGLLVPWLRLAGLDREAERLAAASGDVDAVRTAIYKARDAAWVVRDKNWSALQTKVRAEIQTGPVAHVDSLGEHRTVYVWTIEPDADAAEPPFKFAKRIRIARVYGTGHEFFTGEHLGSCVAPATAEWYEPSAVRLVWHVIGLNGREES